MIIPTPRQPGYVIFDHVTWRNGALREKFSSKGLGVVRSPSGSVLDVLSVTPDQLACVAVLDGANRRGLAGYSWMMERVSALRAVSPTIGVAFVNEASHLLRTKAMPHMTWAVCRHDVDVDAMLSAILFHKAETCAAYRERAFPLRTSTQHEHLAEVPRTGLRCDTIVPNYNVKHLSMLVPLALASRERGCPLFCEISPQEALTYYRVPYHKDTKTMVAHAINAIRSSVTKVNRELGSSLLLHLDHCDDLEIIDHAAGVGFDSIMADGSGRSLEQNITFVKKAKAILSRYTVAIEGEVGNIDGTGPRKWNRTRKEDLVRFLEETGVDYVGIHVGQFHGFSYDYQRSRSHYSSIRAAREAAESNDWPSFISACQALDADLEQQGISRASDERTSLEQCVTLALDGRSAAPHTVSALLDLVARSNMFRVQSVLSRLEEIWLQRRVIDVRRRNQLWDEILNGSGSEKRSGYARVDWDLLADLAELTAKHRTAPVLHGGSSIHDDDLSLLGHYRVARVNFGTQIFAEYVAHLAAGHAVDASRQLASRGGALTFLDEYAREWERWIERPPESIVAFSERIIAKQLDLFTVGVEPQKPLALSA